MNKRIETVTDLCNEAAKYLKTQVGDIAYRHKKRTIEIIDLSHGSKRLEDLTADDWRGIVLCVICRPGLGKRSTRLNEIYSARSVFYFGNKSGWVKKDFIDIVDKGTAEELLDQLESQEAIARAKNKEPEAPSPMPADPRTIPAPPPPTINVELIEAFGSDAKTVDMARISFGSRGPFRAEQYRFIQRLLKNRHLTPFEHSAITFFIECPIYVARQIQRYRTAVISERSLRYCKPIENIENDPDNQFYSDAYVSLLRADIPNEKARAILPLWTVTQFYFTINLRNLMNLFDQRLDEHAQEETRELARKMFSIAYKAFPETFHAYRELKDEASKED